MGYGQPVPMDLEIGGFTVGGEHSSPKVYGGSDSLHTTQGRARLSRPSRRQRIVLWSDKFLPSRHPATSNQFGPLY